MRKYTVAVRPGERRVPANLEGDGGNEGFDLDVQEAGIEVGEIRPQNPRALSAARFWS